MWEDGAVKKIESTDSALEITKSGKPSVIAVYAPWCQFCQKMEEDFAEFAAGSDIDVYKFRGDEEREFVSANLNTESFPTVNVVKADGSVVKYESEDRSVDAINKFVADTLA